jgi:hypothetical protein
VRNDRLHTAVVQWRVVPTFVLMDLDALIDFIRGRRAFASLRGKRVPDTADHEASLTELTPNGHAESGQPAGDVGRGVGELVVLSFLHCSANELVSQELKTLLDE